MFRLKPLIRWWKAQIRGYYETGEDFCPCKVCGHRPVYRVDRLMKLFACRTWCEHCGYELLSSKTARGFGKTPAEAIDKSLLDWKQKQNGKSKNLNIFESERK